MCRRQTYTETGKIPGQKPSGWEFGNMCKKVKGENNKGRYRGKGEDTGNTFELTSPFLGIYLKYASIVFIMVCQSAMDAITKKHKL